MPVQSVDFSEGVAIGYWNVVYFLVLSTRAKELVVKARNLAMAVVLGAGLAVSLTVSLAACNKTSNGIPAVGPLTAEQKARLQVTADALADATQFKAKAFGTSLGPTAAPTSEKRDQVLKSIDEQCVMAQDTQTLPPQAKASAFKVSVSSRAKTNDGPKCPIEFSWETTTTNKLDDKGALTGGRVELVMHYAPVNDDAKAALGTQRYDFNAATDITVQSPTSMSYKGSGRGAASAVINGVLQDVSLSSQSGGTIGTDSANYTYAYNLVYRDGLFIELKLVLGQAGAGQPLSMSCTLNGDAVDPKEFVPLLNKLGFETRLPSQLKN